MKEDGRGMSVKFGRGWPDGTIGIAVVGAAVLFLALGFLQRPRRVSPGTADSALQRDQSGHTRNVGSGDSLQRAIDTAAPGDTLLLEAGASFTGSFVLPAKKAGAGTDADYITVRTSTPDATLAAAGSRVTPSSSSLMAHLLSPGGGQPVLSVAPGAHHYRLIGLEIAPRDASAEVNELVSLGDGSGAQNSIDKVPHHLVIDRCFIHGLAGVAAKRGVGLQSGETWVMNSWISDIKSADQDSQAVCGWNGPGPWHITNNYLEAAGENLMIGGADPRISELVPSDIEIKRNHIVKPLGWKTGQRNNGGRPWVVKNLLELKNAQRVTIEGNVFENCWRAAQGGTALVLTPRNQEGNAPWSTVNSVRISNNVIRHANNAIGLLAQDDERRSQVLHDIEIANNLAYDIDPSAWGAGENGGAFVTLSGAGARNISVAHNTAVVAGMGLQMEDGTRVNGLVLADNIMHYQILGGDAAGTEALERFVTNWQVRGNVIVIDHEHDYWASRYPVENFFPSTFDDVGFANVRGADFRLRANSRYRGKGTDRTDIGCDFSALAAATGAV